MTFRVKQSAEDRFVDAQLRLNRSTRAAYLVADHSFPALLAQAGNLRLKSIGEGGRQFFRFARGMAGVLAS